MAKNKLIIISIGILLVAPLVFVGTVYIVRKLTKNGGIEFNKERAEQPLIGERDVDLIGIFPPGFDSELSTAIHSYENEYGQGKFQVLSYKGFTLIIPPSKVDQIENTKKDIDGQISGQTQATPSTNIQTQQISQIRNVFSVKGEITYNSSIGAYTDENGYQYNFLKGELVNKQVGASSSLAKVWEDNHPYMSDGAVKPKVSLSDAQAKELADEVIKKLFEGSVSEKLLSKVSYDYLGSIRLGITYGDNETKILIDKVSGEIIHYSKVY